MFGNCTGHYIDARYVWAKQAVKNDSRSLNLQKPGNFTYKKSTKTSKYRKTPRQILVGTIQITAGQIVKENAKS